MLWSVQPNAAVAVAVVCALSAVVDGVATIVSTDRRCCRWFCPSCSPVSWSVEWQVVQVVFRPLSTVVDDASLSARLCRGWWSGRRRQCCWWAMLIVVDGGAAAISADRWATAVGASVSLLCRVVVSGVEAGGGGGVCSVDSERRCHHQRPLMLTAVGASV